MSKKSKKPLPIVGDFVSLRGRSRFGTLIEHSEWNGWCKIEWKGEKGPLIVHINELEKID